MDISSIPRLGTSGQGVSSSPVLPQFFKLRRPRSNGRILGVQFWWLLHRMRHPRLEDQSQRRPLRQTTWFGAPDGSKRCWTAPQWVFASVPAPNPPTMEYHSSIQNSKLATSLMWFSVHCWVQYGRRMACVNMEPHKSPNPLAYADRGRRANLPCRASILRVSRHTSIPERNSRVPERA